MPEEDRMMDRALLMDKIRDRRAVLSMLTDRMDAEVMDRAPGLKVIANYAVGYNNIDIEAAAKRGIFVTNTPDVLTDATADHAWALLMAVSRRIVEADRYMREGRFKAWSPFLLLGKDFAGKTLGIIGAGRIGTAVAMRSSGFNMKILYADESANAELERRFHAERTDLKTLLSRSDYVSLHVPLTEKTRGLIGQKELSLMKPAAFLINTSRGPVINEKDLVRALKDQRIAGAGLDVYENEPAMSEGLAQLENVVLTPHIASGTVETRDRMAVMAAENIIAVLDGKIPLNLVNKEVLNNMRSD
jgi:glyoxylate reductase